MTDKTSIPDASESHYTISKSEILHIMSAAIGAAYVSVEDAAAILRLKTVVPIPSGSPQPEGDVVVTKNDQGQIVAVTRQNEEGQVLSVISESEPQPVAMFDECAASGAGHRFGAHGPNGERQCEYCGEHPVSKQPVAVQEATYNCEHCGAPEDYMFRLDTAPAAPTEPKILPPAELIWLYTHCLAIGMTGKSDSGKLEHDIALWTLRLVEETKKLKDEQAAPKAEQAKGAPLVALDKGFKYENGIHTPTVLVGFAPGDWKSRDEFVASLAARAAQGKGVGK